MSDENKSTLLAWNINREVSIGDLVAFVTAAFAVGYSYFTLDTRVRLVEQALQVVTLDQTKQDQERTRIRLEIREELRDVNVKLDRLASSIARLKGSEK